MRIALDLDGVLADTIRVWLRIWNEQRFPKLTYESIDSWDFWRKLGISEAEFAEIFSRAWQKWEEIPPAEEGLSEKVMRLSELGRVDVVTGRPAEERERVAMWLRRHRISYRNLVMGVTDKVKLGYDVYIDDSPIVATEGSRTGRTVLLRDQPWNRFVRSNSYVRRVRGLDEAVFVLSGEL
ncbi:MAG: hypothetical protein QXO17_04490 [Nitrososphaerota archaeon]